eukprot:1159239-Pelagomonas_calceolata.AAC.8
MMRMMRRSACCSHALIGLPEQNPEPLSCAAKPFLSCVPGCVRLLGAPRLGNGRDLTYGMRACPSSGHAMRCMMPFEKAAYLLEAGEAFEPCLSLLLSYSLAFLFSPDQSQPRNF